MPRSLRQLGNVCSCGPVDSINRIMNSKLIFLASVCVAAALTIAEGRDLTSSALEQLFQHRRQAGGPFPQRRQAGGLFQHRRQAGGLFATGRQAGGLFATGRQARGLFPKRRQAQCQKYPNPSVAIMQCLQPLEELEHPASGLNLDQMDTPEAIDTICQLMDGVTACVNEVHVDCGEEDLFTRTLLETLEGVVGYMCHPEIKQLIVEEAECWNNTQLDKEIRQCPSKIRPRPGGSQCGVLEGMIDCAKNVTEELCNPRAAKFVARLLYLSMEPIAANMMNCQIQERVARSVLNLLPLTRK